MMQPVPEGLLREVARQPEPEVQTPPAAGGGFDLELWIHAHLPEADGPSPWSGGRKWVLPICPWDPSHTNRSAYVLQLSSGAISAGCLHNSCRERRWHDLRDLREPGWREAKQNGTSKSSFGSLEVPTRVGQSASAPPSDLPDPWIPFPVEALPGPLRNLVSAGASSHSCDPVLFAMPAIAVPAGLIGNARRIVVNPGTRWTEPAIVWSAIVAESGMLKSPTLDKCVRPVEEIQRKKTREHREAMKLYQAEQLRHECDIAKWKKSGGGDDPPEPPEEPIQGRVLISDPTAEAAALILCQNPRGVILARDELGGWVGAFDAYKTSQADGPFWLQAFRGAFHVIDRKTGPYKHIAIPMVTVSICGTFQPRALAKAFGSDHFDDGLAARFLMAAPPKIPKRWPRVGLPLSVEECYARTLARLSALPMGVNDNGEPSPNFMILAPEAQELYIAFYNEFAEEQAAATGYIASALAKLEGYVPRLAMVFELVEWAGQESEVHPPQQVSRENVERAIEIVTWFSLEIPRVYKLINESDEERDLRESLDALRALGGPVTVRDVMRKTRRFGATAEEVETALEALVARGAGVWEEGPGGPGGGRPTRRFRLVDPTANDTTPESPQFHEVVSTVDAPGQDQTAVEEGGREPGDDDAREAPSGGSEVPNETPAPDDAPEEVVTWTE